MCQFTQPPQQPQVPPSNQPVYQPYPQGYAMPPKTNTLAILSLVFAFLFPLVGAILGFVALGQLKKPGVYETGSGLATAGIIIGLVFTVPIFVIVLLALLGPTIGSIFSNIVMSL